MSAGLYINILSGFAVLLTVSLFNPSVASFDEYENRKQWESRFPHTIKMEIGGISRILVREIVPPTDKPPATEDHPLSYVDHKNQLANTYTYEVVFSSKEKKWFDRGKPVTLPDYSPFTEGLRYVWTRDFRLLSTTWGYHSDIDKGDYALCVGTLHFDENGLICRIDNRTGHMSSTLTQLLHMVADLQRMGAISPSCKVLDYGAKLVTKKNPFTYEKLSEQEKKLRLVQTPEAIKDAYVMRFSSEVDQTNVKSVKVKKSLAEIVFDILYHESLERREEYKSKKSQLIGSRPHGKWYGKILEIQKYSSRLRQAKGSILKKMIKNRPYPELYDAILGTPEMPVT